MDLWRAKGSAGPRGRGGRTQRGTRRAALATIAQLAFTLSKCLLLILSISLQCVRERSGWRGRGSPRGDDDGSKRRAQPLPSYLAYPASLNFSYPPSLKYHTDTAAQWMSTGGQSDPVA